MMNARNQNARESASNLSCASMTSAVTRLSGYLLFAGLLCGFVWSCPAHAASFLADLGQGVSLKASVTVAFQGATVTDSINVLAPHVGADPVVPAASTSTPLAPRTALLPTTGDPKDIAEGSMGVLMDFGSPVGSPAQDTISFTPFAEASAFNAKNSIGENASAQVFLEGSMEIFSTDPNNGSPILPPNTLIATMTISNTFVTVPFEIGEVRVFQDGLSVAFQNIGAGDVIVPILSNHSYLLRVQDGLDVPFGNDPVFDRTIIAIIAAIPEPSSLALIAMPLIGLLPFGRRRRRGV